MPASIFIAPSGQGLQHIDVQDLPYLGKLMDGEGTRASTETSPHFEFTAPQRFSLFILG